MSFHSIEIFVRGYAEILPLDVFVGVLSFIEELLPIIPATAVMIPAGSLAMTQGYGLMFLLWLALISTITKTVASWLLYVLGDKAENAIVRRFGWLFGVKSGDVEKIGERFSGGWKDDLVLLFLRTAPFVPTPPVSIICGVIRFNLRTYLWTTFVGFLIKNIAYLYIGYAGIKAFARLVRFAERYNIHFNWALVFVTLSVFIGVYWMAKRKKKIDKG